jgi:hypothetical protein
MSWLTISKCTNTRCLLPHASVDRTPVVRLQGDFDDELKRHLYRREKIIRRGRLTDGYSYVGADGRLHAVGGVAEVLERFALSIGEGHLVEQDAASSGERRRR